MKRIGFAFMVVLALALCLPTSTYAASSHVTQVHSPKTSCSADGCDGILPNSVNNCLDSGLFHMAQQKSVYDNKGIFLGYAELWFSTSCDAYWGTFYYPRFQHAITQVMSATDRVNASDDPTSGTGYVTSFCPCFSNAYYDAPMLGYDGTGEIDGHYGSIKVCDDNGCTNAVNTAVDNQH